MSRRLRQETDALQRVKIEADEDDDKIKKNKERIFAPISWGNVATHFRVQDLKEKYYEDVIDLIKKHYINTEVLLRNVEMLKDEVSSKSFSDIIMYVMKDTTSLIALDESQNDRLAAVVILYVIHKADYDHIFTKVIMNRGEAQKKLVALYSALTRNIDIFEKFDCESYLRLFGVCVHPDYRHKGTAIGFKMMKTCVEVARSLKLSVIMGIFSCARIQNLAEKIGMEKIQEIAYMNWLDSAGHMIFDDPGAGNYTCALMVGKIPPASPHSSQRHVQIKPEVVKEDVKTDRVRRTTRQEKRDLIARNNL